MPWQIFLLCSFLCYIINAITLYWSLEQMDMTNKDEDDAIVGAVATSVLAFGVAINVAYNNQSSIPREPYTNKDQEREFYMNSILNGSDVHCIGQIRMSKHVFYELCNALRRNNLLCSTKNMSIQEQVLIFLEIVGFNERFRKIGSHFYRSIESIHRCFHTVLQAVLKLYPILIKPSDGTIQPEIRNNYRYYPWFANCVGAIDGTHVLASVPIEQQSRFRGRKGTTTQNVLAAINFNLKFTYVLAGWEGSAHDSRILNDALERPHGFQIPQDKFYLGDAGYGLRKGFIPPYHGVRYHLQEYSDRPPQNEKELFNLRHASLRSSVEHAFAILKRRFRVIDNEPFWDFKTQVDVFNLKMLKLLKALKGVKAIKPKERDVKKLENAINEQLGMDCSPKHVENHLKTLRSTWNTVQTLLNKSGLGWDDNLKMITASPRVYAMHIQAHPSHDKFINKKIDMFEEMSLVCGNDRARGDCAKSFEDIGLDCSSEKGNEDEIEGPSKENGVQDVSETSQVKSSRKRNRPSDVQDVVGDISTKLGEVAAAISKIADSRLDLTRLYEEVMAIEGYGEEFLGDAFDYLVQSDTLAKGFMAKNQNLRKVWLERFKRQHK
ncbi:uncharacterized protein LOC125826253 [Solanum verrucosum]|uniref:uncharacterized protein LOC125826253 n=1 Tax=Solanum verrucosum TaxID=315347 RepID=UPI0020D1CF54|nr:uncharacterized protein LOC125826253 [Solanum verrucosum]